MKSDDIAAFFGFLLIAILAGCCQSDTLLHRRRCPLCGEITELHCFDENLLHYTHNVDADHCHWVKMDRETGEFIYGTRSYIFYLKDSKPSASALNKLPHRSN